MKVNEHNIPIIEQTIFFGKQRIPWDEVEKYAKNYVGKSFVINETGNVISIGGDFPDEFAWSNYTKSLRGALAKVKANSIQIIEKLIENATNMRFVENKDKKHSKDASEGWHRYDASFYMKVMGNNECESRYNKYKATLVVRLTDNKMYLYDVINIKKEST